MKFYLYSNVLCQGASGSGKTSFIKRIIEERNHMFFKVPSKIIFIYSIYQSIYDEIAKMADDIVFIRYIPNENDLHEMVKDIDHALLIIDDMVNQIGDSESVASLFVKNSHHMKITTFVLLQSSNLSGRKYGSEIVRNAHYTILFRGGQMAHVVRSLGTRINDHSNLLSAYKQATSRGTFSYLCVNTHPRAKELEKYSTDILHSEQPTILFIQPGDVA